jgi:HK97 family phage major capsid protein
MRKQILLKKLQRLNAKKAKLAERCNASTDATEVRSLTEELDELNAEINETQEEIDAIEAEEKANAAVTEQEAERSNVPAGATLVNPLGSFVTNQTATQERSNTDRFASMEYRQAFKDYVQRGVMTPIIQDGIEQMQKRNGAAANIEQLGAIVPKTLVQEFINEIRKVYGQLFTKVRKLNIQGGVRFPVGELEATFHWISESTVSPRQDGGDMGDIMFEYNIGEIRVAQTLLSSIVALDLFEREVVNIMVKAYLQAMDIGIVKGTGKGQMLGILNDPRVTNSVEMTAAEFNNWTAWRKKFFAKLPLGYRAGEFIFPLATVDSYLETMADANNNPIFRQATGLEVNDGDAMNPNGTFFGRAISLVEPDVIPDFDTASDGDVVGIFWQPDQYAINSNMDMAMKRYFDDETNKWVNKLLTIVDGRVLNPKGFVLIKKKA